MPVVVEVLPTTQAAQVLQVQADLGVAEMAALEVNRQDRKMELPIQAEVVEELVRKIFLVDIARLLLAVPAL